MGKSFPTGMFDDKLQEVMKLLEEQGEEMQEAQDEPMKSKEELLQELMNQDNEDTLAKNHAAFVEYSMMMKQFEALMEEYERQEAEEEAARRATEGSVN